MHVIRRLAAPAACLTLTLLLAGCATDAGREQQVIDAISGHWRNERALPDRSGWRQLLTITDGLNGPEPLTLELRPDGTGAERGGTDLQESPPGEVLDHGRSGAVEIAESKAGRRGAPASERSGSSAIRIET